MEFNNVKLIGPANIYFGGACTSRTFYDNGEKKTLGFICRGEYLFSSSYQEIVEIISGKYEIKLPGETDYKAYGPGEAVTIPKGIEFHVRTDTYVDYVCTYV